jgi:hypothetical protein
MHWPRGAIMETRCLYGGRLSQDVGGMFDTVVRAGRAVSKARFTEVQE